MPSPSSPPFGKRASAAWVLLATALVVVVVWILLPAIPQDQAYHAFADARAWFGIPRAADVLSNLAFVAAGWLGVVRLAMDAHPTLSRTTRTALWFVAVGVIATGVGSAWYHSAPSDATLVWDRLPMTFVFAGTLGAAVAQRIGASAGRWALAVMVAVGIASVLYWRASGDLSLYLCVQFGGIAILVVLLLASTRGDDPFRWWWLIVAYALAKACEMADRAIWEVTGGLLAGHAVKHLLAAVAVAMIFAPLRRTPPPAA